MKHILSCLSILLLFTSCTHKSQILDVTPIPPIIAIPSIYDEWGSVRYPGASIIIKKDSLSPEQYPNALRAWYHTIHTGNAAVGDTLYFPELSNTIVLFLYAHGDSLSILNMYSHTSSPFFRLH